MKKTRLALLAILPAAMAGIADPVKVDGGLLSGTSGANTNVRVYRGIPFAAPPVGELRWKAPKPVTPWQGVKQADHFSNSCVQKIVDERKPWTYEFMTHGPISEDCLYLNVWTAATNANERRPVLVWIYGGGLNEGSGQVPVYDGEALAAKGVVVVNMNYRLNIFGFFTHPELTKESDRNSSGNYGYLDQVAALQWVKKNIAAFGGDPERVTIAGQSAGAGSVLALLSSPLARGLFVRAITESGSRIGRASRPLKEGEAAGVKFAAAQGARSLKDLRAIKAEALFDAKEADKFRWGATVDGWFLPATVDAVFAQGKQNDVPMLTGSNADEGSSAATYGKIPLAEWAAQSKERYGKQAEAFFKLFPNATQAQSAESQVASAREDYLVSTYVWAVNRAKTAKTPIYTYYWTHAEPGPDRDLYRAFHTSEVPYVFATLAKSTRPWTANDRDIAEKMSSYWVNFIATGDPNGKGLPSWPAFDAAKKTVMKLGDVFAPGPIAAPERFAFFQAYYQGPK